MQILINGKTTEMNSEINNIAALVEFLNATGKRIAIEQNGQIVPRSLYAQTALKDGDKLEIVGAVGGG